MGNFLADVGRANVLGTATQTISAIDSMQRNRALNEESAMRLQKEQYALNQQKKEDAWLDERVPLRSERMYLQLSEEHKKKVDNFFVEQGGMNPETGLIERRNMLRGVKFMEETKEGMETFLKPLLDDQLGELNQLQVQIKEAEAKGDTKKIQTLQPMLEAKTKQYGMGSKVYGDRLEQIREIEKIEAKKKSEQATPTGQIGQFYNMYGRLPSNTEELRTFLSEVRPTPQPTVSERDMIRRQNATMELQELAKEDPNKAYAHGIRMNEDGTVYINPVTNAPVVLPNFTKVMGKRGGVKVAKEAGEYWDDCVELQELLRDPEVKKNLEWADEEGLWDRVAGKWSNSINRWMLKKGIATNSKTTTAIARTQMLASSKRKEYLGTAVTATELESILGWLPSGGDSFSSMLIKTNLAAKEGEEVFRRYLDIYKDVADMSPFYKAFGIQRFSMEAKAGNDLGDLRNKYGLE